MNCKDYYTSVDAIKGADTITTEAYEAAKIMYQSGWGWQYGLNHLKEGATFESNEEGTLWKCRNCGAIFEGKEPPEVCPVCAHPKAYFERRAENY